MTSYPDKDYYKDVAFPELEPEPKPEPVDTTDPCTLVEWDGILTEVRRMIAAVESGESTIVPRAIAIGASAPIAKRLEILAEARTTPALREFLKAAEQDINVRFRRECVLLFFQNKKLKEIMKGGNIE